MTSYEYVSILTYVVVMRSTRDICDTIDMYVFFQNAIPAKSDALPLQIVNYMQA